MCAGDPVTDNHSIREARSAELFDRAEARGALLELDPPVRVGDIEILATLADATQTAIVYRAPTGARAIPRAVAPRDLKGGSTGGRLGEYQIAHMPPIGGQHSTITGSFGRPPDRTEVALPLDRRLSAPYERHGMVSGMSKTVDGVTIRILGAAVGLLMATVDVEVI